MSTHARSHPPLAVERALSVPLTQALLDFAASARIPALVRLFSLLDAVADATLARPESAAIETELLRYGAPEKLQYFQKLELHPVKVNLTYRPEGEAGLLLPIPQLDAAPICLSALVREHLFGSTEELAAAIGSHYKYAVLRQLYRVVLQACAARSRHAQHA